MATRSFCIAVVFSLLFSTSGMGQSNTNINVQLKWWHQFQFAGYYAAIKHGYYTKAGLNVTLIPGDAKHAAVDEVLSGHANFGVTGSDLLIEYSKGKPLMALGAIFQHSPYVIISSAASHINSPSDLVGKAIMVSENQGWVELKAIFLKEGIDIKNISVKGHSWNNMDLVEGRIDAMTGYRSVEPFQLQQLGVQPSYILPINYGVDFYGDILFSTRPFVKQNPQLVEDFRQASFRGWEYAMSHKEEICNYILTLPGVAERKVTKAALMYEAEEMDKLILPQLIEMGHMNEGRWNHILTIHQSLGLIPANTRLDQFVYEKKPSLSESLKNIGAVVLASVVLLFLMVLTYGIMVRKAVKRKTKEQRQALEALSSSEDKYRTLVEQASDGIVICDQHLRFIQANSAALTLLGYTKEELSNLRLPDLLVIKGTDPSLRLQELNTGQDLLSERVAKRKDGSFFTIEIHSNRLSNGNYLGFVRDITERKNQEAEKEKRAAEREMLIYELTNTNRELKQFSYITSHNLRAPVTNLIAITRLIDLTTIPDPETRQLIQGFTTSTRQLNETLDDLIRILIIKENTTQSLEIVSFEEAFQHTRNSILFIIEKAGAVIRTDFSACSEISYNRSYMESIFMNLVSNSIKFAYPGRTPEIDIYTEIINGQPRLIFKDNGSGFDMKKTKDRLFGLHQRFHNHPESKGVGLYLIHSQITSLGGTIEAHSEVGVGTTFIVRF
ncbi:MAG: ABC transporter substrate-binding protein [Bacteroidota bacterium]